MWTRLHGTKPSLAAGLTSKLAVVSLGGKSSCKVKDGLRTMAAVVSGEAIYSAEMLDNDRPLGVEMLPDAVSMGALAADTAPTSVGFAIDDEFDLDKPTEGFASIPEAIEDIRRGKIVIVVDDEDGENEGDMVMAAELATPEVMAFFVKHGTGIVCVSMKDENLGRLQLPLMVASKDNEEKLSIAFTVTVLHFLDTVTVLNEFPSHRMILMLRVINSYENVQDATNGTTTGVSAHDRATIMRALASKGSKPGDFSRPGPYIPIEI
ncbi:hypothetical protein Cgig2_003742 [Carnegiea gigantea]|uniref:3,4-dihydroxy-2-butanone-4-phosphate synthase n=1 Tax=Carnegiea gigantea TaxID=171969 RepID=A0A9Q1JRS3_9CARY|nr:hypothetical protein Cgig2_003742 [Carnegiea gigantea]